MTSRDMRWWLFDVYLQFSLQDFFQTHLADSMSQHQPDVQLHQQVSYYEIKHLTLQYSSKLVYRFLMPLMQDLFGCDHQGLYEIPDSFMIPYLATPSQGGGRRWNISLKDFKILTQIIRKMHRLTPDSLTCLLLRKLNDSIDDRFIKCRLNFYHLH